MMVKRLTTPISRCYITLWRIVNR